MRADEDAHAQLRPADLLTNAAVLSVVQTHATILNGNLMSNNTTYLWKYHTKIIRNSESADLQSERSELLHALNDVVGDLLLGVELERVDVLVEEPGGGRHEHVQRLHLLLVQNLGEEHNLLGLSLWPELPYKIRLI